MELIEQYFSNNKQYFTSSLVNAGFSSRQAERFLPVAAASILHTRNSNDIVWTINHLMSAHPERVLERIQIASLADHLGISAGMAVCGLSAIQPLLADLMTRNKQAIVDTIIAMAWNPDGSLTDAAKRVFH